MADKKPTAKQQGETQKNLKDLPNNIQYRRFALPLKTHSQASMFITVKFGEDEIAIFNPQCRIVNLVQSLKEKCKCEPDACIDLMDEAGKLMNFSEQEHSPEFASGCLRERSTYILVRVTKMEGSEANKYESLLQNLGRRHPDLADRLQKLSNPQAKEKDKERHRKISVPKKASPVKEMSTAPFAKQKTVTTGKKTASSTTPKPS